MKILCNLSGKRGLESHECSCVAGRYRCVLCLLPRYKKAFLIKWAFRPFDEKSLSPPNLVCSEAEKILLISLLRFMPKSKLLFDLKTQGSFVIKIAHQNGCRENTGRALACHRRKRCSTTRPWQSDPSYPV